MTILLKFYVSGNFLHLAALKSYINMSINLMSGFTQRIWLGETQLKAISGT